MALEVKLPINLNDELGLGAIEVDHAADGRDRASRGVWSGHRSSATPLMKTT
jgi:hypothetical protein